MILLMPLFFDVLKLGQNETFIEGFEKILKINKIPYEYIRYLNQKDFWQKIEKSDYFIARWRGVDKDLSLMHAILPEIEKKGVKALPDFNTVYHCGDKLRLAAFYEANCINAPKSFLFWIREDYFNWIDSLTDKNFPLVAKLRQGAGSINVAIVKNIYQAKKLGNKFFARGIRQGFLEEVINGYSNTLLSIIFKFNIHKAKKLKYQVTSLWDNEPIPIESSCLILQEYLPNNSYDTRVTVIGNRAFAFIRKNRPDDFRASGSRMGDMDPKKVNERFIELAFDISKKFKFQTMAYDFLYDTEGNPQLVEMNFTYVDKYVAACPIYWLRNGETRKNNGVYPQYWQLVDLLNDPNLKSE